MDETVRSYDRDAAAYASASPAVPDSVRTDITPGFVELLRGAGLPTVLARLVRVTHLDGLLRISLREGDGDGWSTHGSISSPRHFTHWRAPDVERVVAASRWTDVSIRSGVAGHREESWLEVSAVRDSVSP